MSPTALADARRTAAQWRLDAQGHRQRAEHLRAIADAHDAVADALERGPDATPIPDTLPAPEPTR